MHTIPINVLYLHETVQMSGAEQSLLHLVKYLDKDKFQSHFILPQEGIFAQELRKLGVKVYLVSLPRIRGVWGVVGSMRAIYSIIKDNHIHILHSNSIRTHLYSGIVGKIMRIPTIWHQRNLLLNERIDPDRLLAFLPDKIICNSFSVSRRFTGRGRKCGKITVVHNGVDIQKFSPREDGTLFRNSLGINNGEIVIGTASRFGPEKGHETFLRAVQIVLKKSTRKCRFLIVGDAVFPEHRDREEYLKNAAEKLGIRENVIFTGFIWDMPSVYAAMDIFVLASDNEACGRVVLEAMAMGKPVIATKSGGTPEIVGDKITGMLVSPRDPSAMASAILFLLENKEMRKSMGKAARSRIEGKFTIQQNVKKISRAYIELCSRYHPC